jgi:RNA polymerase sigma-70 factor (ECF subfamily)
MEMGLSPKRQPFPAILAAAQAGDDRAAARLYGDLQGAVLEYLRTRAGQDAEDLASETWLDVTRNLGSFSGDAAAFRRWVFTIVKRRLIDFRRATARRPAGSDSGPIDGLPAGDDTASAALAGLSGDSAIRRVAALLPAEQAEVVLLRVVGGLGTDEVAKITGRPPGTVRVLQHRGLRQLAKDLTCSD